MKFRLSALVASFAVSALTLAGCSSSAADDEASANIAARTSAS